MNIENLIRRFDQVRLELAPVGQPIARTSNRDMFQMDVRKKSAAGRDERFVVWPGAEGNVAVVQASDRALEQVVLFVKEEEREFWERIPMGRLRMHKATPETIRARLPALGQMPIAKHAGDWWVSRTAPAAKRHFLIGRDERQLFMCRLPRACTSVVEAHEVLKAPQLASLERDGDGKTIRQGEWFFIALPEVELGDVEGRARANGAVVRRRTAISAFIARPGKAHVADEIVLHRPIGVTDDRVYVRGAVRHPDHKTIKLLRWHRVLRNNEPLPASGVSLFGGRWID